MRDVAWVPGGLGGGMVDGRGAPVVAPCVLHPDELAAAEAAARRAPIRS